MKIFFVGMPGSGKTTLGEQVAIALDMPFVDLDKEIEKHEKKSVPEIFQQHGEDYFRQTESALLKDWADREDNFVMSTGGGAPCFHRGMEVINKSGVSFFLDVPLQTLIARTRNKADRPLLRTASDTDLEKRLGELLSMREKIYRQAKFTLTTPTVTSVLRALNVKK